MNQNPKLNMIKTIKRFLLNQKNFFTVNFAILPYHYCGGVIYLFRIKFEPEKWSYTNHYFGLKNEIHVVTSLDCLRGIINSYLENKNKKNLFLNYNIIHATELIRIKSTAYQMPDFKVKCIHLLYTKKFKGIYKEMQNALFQFNENNPKSTPIEYRKKIKLDLNYLFGGL